MRIEKFPGPIPFFMDWNQGSEQPRDLTELPLLIYREVCFWVRIRILASWHNSVCGSFFRGDLCI